MKSFDAAGQPLGVYLHVPYCSSRCGYCDFNTYTAVEFEPGVGRASWLATAEREMLLASESLVNAPAVSTVFFGGGTPTLLPASHLTDALGYLQDLFGLAPNAEVTTEANPDSVSPESLQELRDGGFTRISFGMQSSASHVLRALERTHTPGNVSQAVEWAKAAGFEHINLDLIYGTPGESLADLEKSLDDAISTGVDHISAYSLTIEPGTRLGSLNARGEFPSTDSDDLADKYELVDSQLSAAGFHWYEISNWAKPGGECRHNLLYWQSANWWAIGPGGHSHIAGTRFWNVKHPTAWQQAVDSGQLPWQESETLTQEELDLERLLLGIRLSEGLPLTDLPKATVEELVSEKLATVNQGHMCLTVSGRLLADQVVHRLLAALT